MQRGVDLQYVHYYSSMVTWPLPVEQSWVWSKGGTRGRRRAHGADRRN
jgi:hypothetical protein